MKMRFSRGYIALTSAIIISAILSAIVFSASTGAYFGRFDALGSEEETMAKEWAHSCAEVAFAGINEDDSSAPFLEGKTVAIDTTHSCTIDSITRDGATATVTVRAHEDGISQTAQFTLQKDPAGIYRSK